MKINNGAKKCTAGPPDLPFTSSTVTSRVHYLLMFVYVYLKNLLSAGISVTINKNFLLYNYHYTRIEDFRYRSTKGIESRLRLLCLTLCGCPSRRRLLRLYLEQYECVQKFSAEIHEDTCLAYETLPSRGTDSGSNVFHRQETGDNKGKGGSTFCTFHLILRILKQLRSCSPPPAEFC
jgi:hypothetical protein